VVVTVSEKNEPQAFRITLAADPHFNTIKSDKRARVQDTAITAEALLPGGPYDLWRSGETSRRVKDLAGAFAQQPHLPKMLRSGTILDTLVRGCEQGAFVLRLNRPDGRSRSWWMARPDAEALADTALELVLPKAAILSHVAPELLSSGVLPGLWSGDEITVSAITQYFDGGTVVEVDRGGYKESIRVPKAGPAAVDAAAEAGVANGTVWLLSGPASILGEPIPTGILNGTARLRPPPAPIAAAAILPENLPGAWKDGVATGLSIAAALSAKQGLSLPWKTVKDVVTGALKARFLRLDEESQTWPCDLHTAHLVRLKVATGVVGDGTQATESAASNVLVAVADLEPPQVQDLGDIVPKLLEIRTKTGIPLRFHIRVEMGDGKTLPPKQAADQVNALLRDIKDDLELA
jgi:hypothetical protein